MRWVPPISGVRPTTASTSPNWADSAAQIISQASESSKPAVRHRPWTLASVGNGRPSILWVISSSFRTKSTACSSVRPSKTCTSAPPVKMSPSARTSSARTPSLSAWSSAARESSTISPPNRLSGGSSITTTPRSPLRSNLAFATQLAGRLGQLVLFDVHRAAGQPERIVVVARDHVQVEVEDRLPGRLLAGVQDVDPVAAERVPHALGQPLGGRHGAGQVLLPDLVQVARVRPRDQQRVPASPRVDVHEGDRVLVLLDDLGRPLAGRDGAEDAVVS